MENAKKQAEAYLSRERDHNINMLAALRADLAEVVRSEEHGCLFRTGEDIWQLSADDTETALRLYAAVPDDATKLEVQQTEFVPLFREELQPTCVELYYNAWYQEQDIALPDIGAEVRKAEPEDAMELARHYHLPGPICGQVEETAKYVAERIESGTVFNAYLDGRLAGFVGTHDEGSLGMLTVLPEFRRRGLGTFLEHLAIKKALERGHIPFGQVALDNTASLALQDSVGLTLSKQAVCWMEK